MYNLHDRRMSLSMALLRLFRVLSAFCVRPVAQNAEITWKVQALQWLHDTLHHILPDSCLFDNPHEMKRNVLEA